MKRILVIRGGAIGDFILTLPALAALRDAKPDAHIEILGYKQIAALAENRFYSQGVRSIESGPLASFFAKDAELSNEFRDYFANFDLVISYLYDPDKIFETNLRRCGVEHFICGPAKIDNNFVHAARQLAKPVEQLGIDVTDLSARIFPSDEDRQFANKFLRDLPPPIVTIHPGSGSERKNWPIENWLALARKLKSLIVISGEADDAPVATFEGELQKQNVRFAKNLPLPQLAAILENSLFIGHDSGISHLAAAVGAHCILLFGPTDPAIWAPQNENVHLIRAPDGDLRNLTVDVVRETLDHALMRIGMST